MVLHRAVLYTRAFFGNLGVYVVFDQDDPAHWLILESWQSDEHDTAYREFRAGPGAIDDLPPLLAGAPSLTKGPVDDGV